MERTIDGFRGFTACLYGAKEKGIIYGTGVTDMGDIKWSKQNYVSNDYRHHDHVYMPCRNGLSAGWIFPYGVFGTWVAMFLDWIARAVCFTYR